MTIPLHGNIPEPPLPEIHDVVLDRAALDRHFAELARDKTLIAVVTRGTGYAGDPTPAHDPRKQLAAARAALEHGLSVQIRYRDAATEWWDTLMPVSGGTRLVRIDRGAVMP